MGLADARTPQERHGLIAVFVIITGILAFIALAIARIFIDFPEDGELMFFWGAFFVLLLRDRIILKAVLGMAIFAVILFIFYHVLRFLWSLGG